MSKPAIVRIEFDWMPSYEERLSLEAALRLCGAHIQDFIYFYKRNVLRYKLYTEHYETFIKKLQQTTYWNSCVILS